MVLPWKVKHWDGGSWANGEYRKWTGSVFNTANAYYWNGSSWVLMTDRTPPTSTFTKQYTTAFHMSYAYGGTSQRNDGSEASSNYQGNYGGYWGIQCSVFGYNTAIHNDIDGAVGYYYAQVFLSNQHWWYNDYGIAVIGTTASTGVTGTLNANRVGLVSASFSYGQAKWVNLGTQFCSYADDGSFYGLVLYINSNDVRYYGYFSISSTYEHSYEK